MYRSLGEVPEDGFSSSHTEISCGVTGTTSEGFQGRRYANWEIVSKQSSLPFKPLFVAKRICWKKCPNMVLVFISSGNQILPILNHGTTKLNLDSLSTITRIPGSLLFSEDAKLNQMFLFICSCWSHLMNAPCWPLTSMPTCWG